MEHCNNWNCVYWFRCNKKQCTLNIIQEGTALASPEVQELNCATCYYVESETACGHCVNYSNWTSNV